jgi:uncharacterized protein YfaS (alpha-2-macroglobulin family)
MALAQRATIGVGQPVEACWDRVDGGETIGPADPMLDQITARVNLYFDRTYSKTLYATYLARATTRGKYTLPPASGEIMYEPGSEGWSDAGTLNVE